MVKCAKALVYFAGESDSFGKDAEVSMALSLGKPVIILCPTTAKGEQRMKFFRDTHLLSRMVYTWRPGSRSARSSRTTSVL